MECRTAVARQSMNCSSAGLESGRTCDGEHRVVPVRVVRGLAVLHEALSHPRVVVPLVRRPALLGHELELPSETTTV
eukprot:2638833-Rhodomonas_salina.1